METKEPRFKMRKDHRGSGYENKLGMDGKQVVAKKIEKALTK